MLSLQPRSILSRTSFLKHFFLLLLPELSYGLCWCRGGLNLGLRSFRNESLICITIMLSITICSPALYKTGWVLNFPSKGVSVYMHYMFTAMQVIVDLSELGQFSWQTEITQEATTLNRELLGQLCDKMSNKIAQGYTCIHY